MSFFLDESVSSSGNPPKILLPPGVKPASIEKMSDNSISPAGFEHEDVPPAGAASLSLSKKKKKKPADHQEVVIRSEISQDRPFTLQELHEAVTYYLSQGMPSDTPVYITTADRQISPRSKTAMIGIYPGVMQEAGQLRIETRHPVHKGKTGLLKKIFYTICNL